MNDLRNTYLSYVLNLSHFIGVIAQTHTKVNKIQYKCRYLIIGIKLNESKRMDWPCHT